VQGRGEEAAARIREEAIRLADAGCFGVVLELVPSALAAEVTRAIGIPTIGIGAGPDTDGQILVLPDMLGLNEGFQPRFLRRFAELATAAREGIAEYAAAVRDGEFPGPEHSFE
jgi:3-methyl-2-oxobutanoate hydroxymethyltransferase